MIERRVIELWLQSGSVISLTNELLLMGWGERTWLKQPQGNETAFFYFPDFFITSPKSWFVHEHVREITSKELIQALEELGGDTPKVHDWKRNHKDIFHETFVQLKHFFSKGELVKAVPFGNEEAGPMDPAQLRESLRSALNHIQSNPAYIYGFWNHQEGMLGASPELLFRFCGPTTVETMACAGTKSLSASNEEFLNDPKESCEHELVVRGIVESLEGLGKVHVGQRKIVKLTRLAHLITPITLNLKSSVAFQKIVDALHPTPALGAFPKAAGKIWLEGYQKKIDRRRFGAPVGCFMPGSSVSSCYVAIRNVQWNQDKMTISAGCGVVSASQYEKEWAEISLKLQAIKEMLAL